MPEHIQQFTPIADGCFRDTSTLYLNADGKWCFFEFTPIINPGRTMTRDEGEKLVAACGFAGGGWQLTTNKQEVSLRNYSRYAPATDVPDSPTSGWVLTRDDDVSPPSGYVWAVLLGNGDVNYIDGSSGGFVRGGRLVPASQDDLAVGLTQ